MTENRIKHHIKDYKNPPLVETICQFRFNADEDNKWDSSKAQELQIRLLDKYPVYDLINEIGVEIVVEEGKVVPKTLAPTNKYTYSDKSKKKSIIVTQDSFAFIQQVGIDNEYKWDIFKQAVLEAWSATNDCIKIQKLQSIGVRFINHIYLNRLDINDIFDIHSSYFSPIVKDISRL